MRVSTTVRRWLAGLALFALVGSGLGVAALMILGSVTEAKQTQAASTQRATQAPPPQVPTPFEFAINVVVTDRHCGPEPPGCFYKYSIEPKYIGMHPLPETPFTVFYEVVGGNAPQKGEFTVENGQAQILQDVVVEGPPGTQLKANVLQVAG
ncbi:hypothetical protein AU193_09825 [Mycobacterium sp. GA-1285]|uniref:hypothetical protein n=1 Tax=Mycobacterium sp. GA-1285 TaxID=1772282 RepID=UPI0007498D19|nr:hypothetical protein [Mycobacterium sp. GA-1285]KUI22913.1 hypothetical protein AU193_09825 [Mycobacterium sp. GA-1285]